MAVSNQRMIFKKFADRLTPGSRVALLKSATDIIRFGVVVALDDSFIVVRCEDGGIYKIYRSLILLSRDCPFAFDVLTDEQKAAAVAGIELVIRFLRRYLRTAGQDPAVFKPEVRMRSVTPLTDVIKWLIRRCGENATLLDVLRDCALASHPEKSLAEMQAIAALSDDPYFWYITDITLRSLGNIEK